MTGGASKSNKKKMASLKSRAAKGRGNRKDVKRKVAKVAKKKKAAPARKVAKVAKKKVAGKKRAL